MGSIAGLFRALTTYANISCETPKGDKINISIQNYVTNMYLLSGPPSNILRETTILWIPGWVNY